MKTHLLFIALHLMFCVQLANGQGSQARMMAAFESGMNLADSQQYDSAVRQFDITIELANKLLGAGQNGAVHLETAKVMEHKANCLREAHRLIEARRTYDRCLQIARAESGPEGAAMERRTEGNLACIALRLGDLPKAEGLYRDSIKKDTDPYNRAFNEMNLGWTLYEAERLDESKSAYMKSVNFWQRATDPDAEANHASCQHGLGMIALKEQKLQEATRYFETAVAIRKNAAQRDRRKDAYSLAMVGVLKTLRGESTAGLGLLREAENVLQSVWATDHVDLADLQHDMALALGRAGSAECFNKMSSSRRMYRSCAAELLVGLEQSGQLRYLASEKHRVMDALALALQFPNIPDATKHGWEWLLNNKGFSFEVLSQQRLLARSDRAAGREASTATRLRTIRERIAASTNRGVNTSEIGLNSKEQELAQTLGMGGNLAITSWAAAHKVQSRIPQGTVLIDCAFVDRAAPSQSAFGKQPKPKGQLHSGNGRYVAWVVTNREIHAIELGPAQRINAAIASLRESLDEAEKAIGASPRRAKADIDELLLDLSRLVLHPLEKQIGQANKLIICPDGGLWVLPWSALIRQNGRYLIEEAEISFVVSARQLIGRDVPKSREYAMIMADPDFGLSPSDVRRVLRKTKVREDLFPKRSFQVSSSIRVIPRNIRALPATRTEAESAKPLIEKLIRGKTYLYTQSSALESIVKAIKRPRVAVFATHGFLLDDAPSTHPLARSGLLLAGVNNRSDSEGDDGILTALEVLDCDFRGTELVMLSACDTALGKSQVGEGIAGLQQAFHLAGAQRVFATLWKVDDRETSLLMNRFWTHLSAGSKPAKAMRSAQLEYMRDAKTRLDFAHPWLWAAPMMTEYTP